MAGIEQSVIREPEVNTPEEYAFRVRQLAIFYLLLFVASVAGIALLIWKAQFFVTLSQRSNVETLTLAFFLVFFAYIAVISVGGAWGALRIALFAAQALIGDRGAVERRKWEALGPPKGDPPTAALNIILEKDGSPGERFEVPVADNAGSMGRIEVDGAAVMHHPARRDGSNSLLAYFVHQVNGALRERGIEADLDIVEWKKINDEGSYKYLGIVHFARRLERHLGADALWPKVTITEDDYKKVERRLAAVC
ncbi:MAG TPA: hypothetical protein VHL09_07020, partial [Dehalococcoidia bacterium]|nr:hypothetical protein [Dehalococcoidia bacterium]